MVTKKNSSVNSKQTSMQVRLRGKQYHNIITVVLSTIKWPCMSELMGCGLLTAKTFSVTMQAVFNILSI
jgi:hypothetical protein